MQHPPDINRRQQTGHTGCRLSLSQYGSSFKRMPTKSTLLLTPQQTNGWEFLIDFLRTYITRSYVRYITKLIFIILSPMVQSRFAETRFAETPTLTLNPNFGDSGFGESGRHLPDLAILTKLCHVKRDYTVHIICSPIVYHRPKRMRSDVCESRW